MGKSIRYLKVPLYYDKQRGIISLLTSVVVGLILIVITISGIALMSGELRQASDFDQSVKAYFAAEAGLEEAIAEVRSRLDSGTALDFGSPDDCDIDAPAGTGELSPDGAVAYTCQLITSQPNEVQGSLDVEESNLLDLTGLDFTTLQLEWNQRGSADPQWNNPPAIPGAFPPGANWTGRFPSVMEATITSFPDGSFNANQILSETIVLKPAAFGGGLVPIGGSAAAPEIATCAQASSLANGAYACQATLSGFSTSRNYIIRLHARYSRANYRVEARNAAGVTVPIPGVQMTIDVTGRAGDIFRRVQARLPIGPQDVSPSPLHYALLADEAICKVMEVSDVQDEADSETGCAP